MSSTGSAGPRVLPMPDFSSTFPGPFPVSTHADQVEQQILTWLGEFPLLGAPGASRSLCNITSQGVARAFPAADPDRLVLGGELFLFLTAFDDVHGETTGARDPAVLVEHVSELTLALACDRVPNPSSCFPAALNDLLARFQLRASPAQFLRLTGHLRDSLFAIVWEAHHLRAPGRVSVRAYCAMRPYSVFVRTIMAASEIVLQYNLPDDQRTSAPVTLLDTAVANLAGWINDLASYEREAARMPNNLLSLPALLMAEHGLSLSAAFQEASGMCEEQAVLARTRMGELSADGPSPLMDHARALEGIAHSFIWHGDHARYRP